MAVRITFPMLFPPNRLRGISPSEAFIHPPAHVDFRDRPSCAIGPHISDLPILVSSLLFVVAHAQSGRPHALIGRCPRVFAALGSWLPLS